MIGGRNVDWREARLLEGGLVIGGRNVDWREGGRRDSNGLVAVQTPSPAEGKENILAILQMCPYQHGHSSNVCG